MVNSDEIYQYLQSLTSSSKFLLAFSGGLDSHVLLHLLSQLTDSSIKLRAVHIHHGLQDVADDWVIHCQKVCSNLDIPYQAITLNLQIDNKQSIEEAARNGRYKALYESLQNNEVLLTAHHQNDQAETLLLQLFRGAGVNGLASMPAIRNVNIAGKVCQHVRPLLTQTRQSLEEYARENLLEVIVDPSNVQNSFDRNFLRNQIIPQLRDRWPAIDKTISRAAAIQSETKQILDGLADNELYLLMTDNDNTINIPELIKLSSVKQKLVIRHWIIKSGFRNPSDKKLGHVFSDLLHASKDAQPLIEWQDAQLRRFQDRLYIMSPLAPHDNSIIIEWNKNELLDIPQLGVKLQPLPKSHENVTVRFRQGGETMFIPERGVKISLKNLFQEAGIPPWLRSRIPLIYVNEKLIQVIGIQT